MSCERRQLQLPNLFSAIVSCYCSSVELVSLLSDIPGLASEVRALRSGSEQDGPLASLLCRCDPAIGQHTISKCSRELDTVPGWRWRYPCPARWIPTRCTSHRSSMECIHATPQRHHYSTTLAHNARTAQKGSSRSINSMALTASSRSIPIRTWVLIDTMSST